MTDGALLEFEGVSCRRGGRLLFQNLSFALGAGQAMLLHGNNGVGKSSLIRLAAGLIEPVAGRVACAETPALLAHESALDEDVTLEKALTFWSRIDGAALHRIEPAMRQMGLDTLAQVPVRMLSSGQRRRAALSGILASQRRLWLLDEPGVGLDSASLSLLSEAIARHRRSGGAVIAATHMQLGIEGATILDLGSMA